MLAPLSRRLLIGIAAAVVVACGGDSITASDSPSGSYTLQTVNGRALPYALIDTVEGGVAFKLEVLSPSTLTIGTGSDWRFILSSRASFGGFVDVATDTVSGTFTRSGSALTLNSAGDEVFRGTWTPPDQVTLTADGDVLVFKRS